MHAEELIRRWQDWDERPGNTVAVHALSDAAAEYAGSRSNELYKHVAVARRSGLSIAAAIYTWRTE